MKNDWAERFGSEWGYIVRLGRAILDPEEKRVFWETIKRKKEENQSYSIYDDYPVKFDPKSLAERYGGAILDMLKGKKG